MKIKRYARVAAIGTAFALCLTTQGLASDSGTIDNDMLQELKRMIQQQQAQIDKQAGEIAELKKQLGGTSEGQSEETGKAEMAATDKMVSSSISNVNLSLYGHINKAAMFVDNGDSSKWYIVDNINSQTRLGLRANVETVHNWNAGGRIEYGIVSNASSDVNQLDTHDATSSNFKLRWAEVSFKNDQFGKISLGKGASASDNSAEIDLSGTTVASYAGYSDMAGSTLWYDGRIGVLSELEINDVFSDFDGLGRTDRLRYDTPSFAGFSVAASASSGDAYDGSLWYSRKFGDTKVAGAVAYANPGDLKSADSIYSGSVSAMFPMGFNATFSAGGQDLDETGRDNPVNWWGKLGYQVNFYDAAVTSFSIDYGETKDLDQNNDTLKSWALAAVHNIPDWGTELYLAYRMHQLDRDATDFDDIHVFWTGARVKF
ncbi:MAG: porin [Desulforhopalus sp.]